ncbi:MAG: DUF1684 domain-containing protein [Candidatus Hydrogenedentota bacterium]
MSSTRLKRRRRVSILALLVLGIVLLWRGGTTSPLTAYELEVMEWRARFEANMRKTDGYLAITGMFELRDGEFQFGSNPDCAFQVTDAPGNSVPPVIGTFTHGAGKTSFQPADDVAITDSEGNAVTGSTAMELGSLDRRATLLSSGSLSWVVIRRGLNAEDADGGLDLLPVSLRESTGERYYLRVWDARNPVLETVESPAYFPIDPAWRFEGEFRRFDEPKSLYQKNVQGLVDKSLSTGVVVFTKDGVEYSLDTADEGNNLFIVFGDETTGAGTYGGGRFLDVAKPMEGNAIIVDFNKTRNPWCAYSEYTTCALPTENNMLPFPVRVGARPPEASHR